MDKVTQQVNYTPVLFGKETAAFSKEKGLWLLANVDQQIGWPLKKVMMIYRGKKVLLLPATKTFHAAAAIITQDRTLKVGKTFLMQFLSALAWYSLGKIEIVRWTDSTSIALLNNNHRLPLQKRAGMGRPHFKPTEIPIPQDPKAQLALALFREGLSLNHLGYSFLSYYKIINLRYPRKDNRQKKWITRTLPLIENLPHLKDKINKLKASHSDLTAYIYEACRCAVAHASIKETTYDPESIDDEIRFYEIKPILHALAKIMIETEFGIKTTHTIIGEHLYELEGFHLLLGKKISKELKQGKTIPINEIAFNIKISLRLWNYKKLKAFEKLKTAIVDCKNGIVTLSLSRDNILKIPLVLDFPKEKLIFDPTQNVAFNDDGSKNAALQLSNVYQFYSEFTGNPVLEIWETKSNIVLGRLLEYLPTVYPGQPMPHVIKEQCLKKMKEWREKAKEREKNSKT